MQVLDRRRRLAARFLAISLLAATLFAVDSLSSPSPAEARCNGQGHPLRSTFTGFSDGIVRVSETAGFDTCDGNSFYTGVLKDERADGYCVDVFFANGDPPVTWYQAASVCGAGNTKTFGWEDSNHNSRLWEQLCIDNIEDGFRCGWGTAIDGYGLNSGF